MKYDHALALTQISRHIARIKDLEAEIVDPDGFADPAPIYRHNDRIQELVAGQVRAIEEESFYLVRA